MNKIKAFFRREASTIKRLEPRQRRQYIWDYYKAPMLAAVLILALAAYLVLNTSRHEKTALYVVMVNSSGAEGRDAAGEDRLFGDLLEREGYDKKLFRIDIDAGFRYSRNDMTEESAFTVQALAALFSVGNLDLFISDREVFDSYAGYGCFEDLEALLPQEVLGSNAGRIYRCAGGSGKTAAYGIILDRESPVIKEGFYPESAIAGIAAGAANRELAIKALIRLIG